MLNRGKSGKVRLAGILVLALTLTFLVSKFYAEYRSSRERGKFVASLVQEQVAALRRLPVPEELVLSQKNWPDDFLALQGWVILELARNGDPEAVSKRIADTARGRDYSPVMRTSLERWKSALSEWSRVQFRRGDGEQSAEELLNQGRRRHYEAAGYRKIGRMYDATILYLWSADHLSRFIEANPNRSEVPEALYLLGDAYSHFRHVLPAGFRSDRLLNLCMELFPSTVWAQRARNIWSDEIIQGGV
jgi:hypothetical protein